MPVQIGQKKESDFSYPLGLLSDCHRRIERFLDVLIQICKKRNGGTIPADERSSLETALIYFRNSAPRHTADEEESLFPRMRASEAAQAALDCLAQIEGDHEKAAHDHEIVDSLGTKWLSDGTISTIDARDMTLALTRLSTLYARHIAIEDTEVFPLAGRILNSVELAGVGEEMARRRGVSTDASSKMVL